MDYDKYQNLKLILEGSSQTIQLPPQQRSTSKDSPAKIKNRVRLVFDESQNKYDSDGQDMGDNQDTTQAERTRHSDQIHVKKPGILSNQKQRKISHNIIDETTQTVESLNTNKQKNVPNKYQQFMRNVNPLSVKPKQFDTQYLTPVEGATGLGKVKLQTELKLSLSKNDKKIMSSSNQIRTAYSIGKLNTTSAANSTHYQSSYNNLTETINTSNSSPQKQAFRDKLNINMPQKSITSLRNIPSPLYQKEGLNKLFSPKDTRGKGEKLQAGTFLTCATQRGSTSGQNELNSDNIYNFNPASLAQLSTRDGHQNNIKMHSTTNGFKNVQSQPFFSSNHKTHTVFPTMNSMNNLPNVNTNHTESNSRDEMTENFKSILNLIDLNEMKKFEFRDSPLSPVKQAETKKLEKPIIFKPNVQSIDQKLNTGINNLVQLGVNDFTYFCIKVKGEVSPLRVKINQDRMLDYKVMVSKDYPSPSQFNCDYNLQGNVFSFECDNNSGYFTTQQYYYFSIYSNDEAIIHLHVNFGSNYETYHTKQYKEQSHHALNGSSNQLVSKSEFKLSCTDLTNRQLREEVRFIIEKRRKKIGAIGVAQNLIQKNIESLKSDNMNNELMRKKYILEQKKVKIQMAQEQKFQLWENHINTLASQKEEKELKKQEKAIKQITEIKQFQKKTFDFLWITNIVLILATKKLAIKLQRHKERQRLMRDMAFSLLRPFFRYKVAARKIGGQNISLRALLESKYALTGYAQHKKTKVKSEANQVLLYCLRQNAQRHENIKNIITFVQASRKIVEKFHNFHFKIVNFKKLLFRLWEKYYYELVGEIFDVIIDKITLKNATLSKRITQNVQQSFNHIDHKRIALDKYYKRNLSNYRTQMKEYLRSQANSIEVSKTQALKSEHKLQNSANNNEQEVQMSSCTSIQVNLRDKQKELKSKDLIEDGETKQKTQQIIQLKQPSKLSIDTNQIKQPRLFIIPSKEAFKRIIYEASIAICDQYPDLSKKIIFKYQPK